MPTRYDIWKTASPPEYDLEDCCDECNRNDLSDCCGASYDDDIGICMDCKEHCESAGCGDESCTCHWTDEQWKEAKGEADYDAMRDDRLTED